MFLITCEAHITSRRDTSRTKCTSRSAQAEHIVPKTKELLSQFFCFWRRHPESNRGIADLQSAALPLGYGALKYGAADEARTRYLHLGKVALYQMSYSRIYLPLVPTNAFRRSWGWCLRSELNQRHADFQSAALPTELPRRKTVVGTTGLEPVTPCL